jgi:regulator of replication initiation timing
MPGSGGKKVFSGRIHSSSPKEVLSFCGYTDEDIRTQLIVNKIESPGQMLQVLYRGCNYLITVASLVRDEALRSAFICHTFFMLYQRVVGAATVLAGDLDCSNLSKMISYNRDDLIEELAKVFYDGEQTVKLHSVYLASFMKKYVPYGISDTRAEPIEMAIQTLASHVLALDEIYMQWISIMRTHFPYEAMRSKGKSRFQQEKQAVSTAIAMLESSRKEIITQNCLLYFVMIESVSAKYFDLHITRLKQFEKKFNESKKKFKPQPLELTMTGKLMKAQELINSIEGRIRVVTSEMEQNSEHKVTLGSKLTELQTQLNNLNSDLKTLQGELTTIKGQKERLASRCTTLQQKGVHEKQALTSDQERSRELNRELEAEQRKIERLRDQRLYSVDDVKQIESQLDDVRRRCSDLNAAIQQMIDPNGVTQLQLENDKLRRENAEKQRKIEALRAQLLAKNEDAK